MSEESKDEKLIAALKQAQESRIQALVESDPTLQRLQGALDYANGNIKLPEEDEGEPVGVNGQGN